MKKRKKLSAFTALLTLLNVGNNWLLGNTLVGFPGGSMVKNLPANAGDPGLIPGSGRSPGEENGNPRQYSCWGNLMDRGAWQATVHRIAKELDMTWRLNNNNASAIFKNRDLVVLNYIHVLVLINKEINWWFTFLLTFTADLSPIFLYNFALCHV